MSYSEIMYLPSLFYHRQNMAQSQFLSSIKPIWILSVHSPRLVAKPKLKNLICSPILCIAWERTDGFMPFPKPLAQCEMQTASSRIWTQVADFICCNNNHYTKNTLSYSVSNIYGGDALSLMVIIIGNEISDLRSNPGQNCVSLCTNDLEKSMNPFFLLSAIGK